MATNTATIKMIRNIIDGTTPIQSKALLNTAFPVGTIICRTDAVSPASIYGGSWERIVDKFLYSVGGGYSLGEEGGEAEHTLTVAEMPSHIHDEIGAVGQVLYVGENNSPTTFHATVKSNIGGDAQYKMETSSKGGSQPHNNMPPFLAVAAWKRIE